MAAFINNDITAAGLLVLAKGVAGQQINYTKIVLGDGYLEEGQTPRSLTGVVSPKATIDITKCVVNGDGTVTVGGVFTNDQTNDGFYYRELGLYADDPDEDVGEVLYCYGNCGDLAEWIPPTGGATIVEKTIDIVTAIGTATNVTAYIPADAYATKEDYENYKAIALAAQATANQAILLAQQAVGIAEQAAAAVVDLSNVVQQNTSKITTLWDAVFGDITTNPLHRHGAAGRHHPHLWRLERYASAPRVLSHGRLRLHADPARRGVLHHRAPVCRAGAALLMLQACGRRDRHSGHRLRRHRREDHHQRGGGEVLRQATDTRGHTSGPM